VEQVKRMSPHTTVTAADMSCTISAAHAALMGSRSGLQEGVKEWEKAACTPRKVLQGLSHSWKYLVDCLFWGVGEGVC
jgi:hypothetical protein